MISTNHRWGLRGCRPPHSEFATPTSTKTAGSKGRAAPGTKIEAHIRAGGGGEQVGYSPGEVYDSQRRMLSFEARSNRRVELSIIGDMSIWSTLDEDAALKLLEHFATVCNCAFGKKLRIEDD